MSPFAILLGLSLQAVPSQVQPAAIADSCVHGRISSLVINNHSIFSDPDSTGDDRRLGWAYRAANALHARTRQNVIRRELMFAEGDCFEAFRISESERLLREFGVLSRVSIKDVPLPDGTHRVVVDTHDEWSTRVDVRATSNGFGIRAAEENILGTGHSLGVFYVKHDVTEDYGLAFYTPQLLGTRWDMRAEVGRTRAGTAIREEISYPWVGEFSRWASVQGFVRDDRFFDYVAGDDPDLDAPHVLLPLRDKAFDLAIIRRYGRTGNTGMLGVALGYQQLSYPGIIEVAPTGRFEDREPADSLTRESVNAQRATRDNIRLSVLAGHRTVQWVRRRGFDSMHGTEDVPLGAELGIAIGYSVPSLERDNDLYTTLSLNSGVEAGNTLLISKLRADARRALDANVGDPEWEDFYADGELLGYYRPGGNEHHLLFLRAAAIGAWNTRTPFQITLGGEKSLRGYDRERYPGGRRFVVNAEDRIYFGWPFAKALDLGATLFADAGRVWRGDVPFGTDSGWRASIGAGLRTSFPAGSRSLYRIDFAWPIERGTTLRDFRLQMSIGEPLGMNPRVIDEQVMRSRPQGAAGHLFPFSR